MKKFWLLACVLALVAVPCGASELGGGVAFMDSADAGDDSGAAVKFSLDVGENWNIDVRASFFDGHGFIQVGERDVLIEATPIDLGLSYDFTSGGRFQPYLGTGINYTLFKVDIHNFRLNLPEAGRIKDEPGWYAVAGVKGPLKNRIGFFLEALYRQNKANIQGDGLASFGEIRTDFAGAGAALGLSYNW